MQRSRRWRHYAGTLVLGAALFLTTGCSNDIMTLAYYLFSSVTSVLESSLTSSTTTTDTTTTSS